MPAPEVIEDKQLSVNEIDKFLSEDDKDENPLKLDGPIDENLDDVDKDEEEEKEEDKEEKEEDEEKEPTEEDLELATPPQRKEILKAYPDIFKKFPYLEKTIFREKAYTEILPTIEDAREVKERAEEFDKFEGSLLKGSSKAVLQSLKQTDEKAFAKVVDNYMQDIYDTDKSAYGHVIGTIMTDTVQNMFNEGKRIDNEKLQAAAVILNQFIFGNSNWNPKVKFSKEVVSSEIDQEKTSLEKEKEEFARQKFESTRDELQNKTDNLIKAAISENIDPSNSMSEYTKRNAIKDAMESLTSTIDQDDRFKITLDKLWTRASEQNFNQFTTREIQKAYLHKAKSLLRDTIQKVRKEALKGSGQRKQEDKDRRGPLPTGRTASQSNSGNKSNDKPDSKPGKKISTFDFLNSD